MWGGRLTLRGGERDRERERERRVEEERKRVVGQKEGKQVREMRSEREDRKLEEPHGHTASRKRIQASGDTQELS